MVKKVKDISPPDEERDETHEGAAFQEKSLTNDRDETSDAVAEEMPGTDAPALDEVIEPAAADEGGADDMGEAAEDLKASNALDDSDGVQEPEQVAEDTNVTEDADRTILSADFGAGASNAVGLTGQDLTGQDLAEDEKTAFLTSPPQTADAAGGSAKPIRAVTVGTTINNNYEVTHILKAGGMGEVYRGIELGTGDPVAIKAVLPELAEDEKTGLMFKREARTLRQLADPAIVRYYNYLYDRDLGQYFLVMEYIDGLTLSEHMSTTGPLSVPSAFILMKHLANGLDKAHALEVVHRDLSPDNVMMPGGAIEDARLIDFGIAQSNVLKESTMAGSFAGKFKFVSPEQLGHYDGVISPVTDIYGLGLLMAAAVIGTPLNMGNSIVEAVDARRAIPDLSAVPRDLRPLISYMLEPDPADRPASMQEVQRLIENPNMIPEKYGGGGQMVAQVGADAAPVISAPPQGLQVPMLETSMRPGVERAGGARSEGGVQTVPPAKIAGPKPKSDNRNAWLLGGLGVMFVALILFAGIYAWKNDLIGNNTAAGGDPQNPNSAPTAASGSREAFLKTYSPKPCTYLSRVTMGPNTGVIDGYSASGNQFADLPSAYEQAFGARPSVVARQVTDAQCAALDFARALQGNLTSPVQMLVTPDQAKSGENLRADILVNGDQAIWTALISPVGGVYNLSSQLSDNIGGRRSLSFGLNLTAEVASAPQLILTVASDHPIAHAAAARNGSKAEDLLPLILKELQDQNSATSAALSYVLLSR